MNKATEFRKIAIDKQLLSEKWGYNHCIGEIQKAASEGKFEVVLYRDIPIVVQDKLRDEGFDLKLWVPKLSYRMEESSLTIKW